MVLGYIGLNREGESKKIFRQPIEYDNIVAFADGEVYLKEKNLLNLAQTMIAHKGEIFKRFDADFSISCYDKKNKKIYLTRDFFGVKPLYIYWNDKETLFFSSEIKSLKKIIMNEIFMHKKTILDYLIFGYQLEEATFYK